jgi:hypothetical protein
MMVCWFLQRSATVNTIASSVLAILTMINLKQSFQTIRKNNRISLITTEHNFVAENKMENSIGYNNGTDAPSVSNDAYYFFNDLPDLYCVYHPIHRRNVFVVKGQCFDTRDQAAYNWINYIKKPMPVIVKLSPTYELLPTKQTMYSVPHSVIRPVKFRTVTTANKMASGRTVLSAQLPVIESPTVQSVNVNVEPNE